MPRLFLVVGDIDAEHYEPEVKRLRRQNPGMKIVHISENLYFRRSEDGERLQGRADGHFKTATGEKLTDLYAYILTAAAYDRGTYTDSIIQWREDDLGQLTFGYKLNLDGTLEVTLSL